MNVFECVFLRLVCPCVSGTYIWDALMITTLNFQMSSPTTTITCGPTKKSMNRPKAHRSVKTSDRRNFCDNAECAEYAQFQCFNVECSSNLCQGCRSTHNCSLELLKKKVTSSWSDYNLLERELRFVASVVAPAPPADIYLVAGRCNRGFTLDNMERFSLVERQWNACASIPTARGSHGAVAVGGYIYSIAGGGIDSNLNTCEVFDTKKQTWDQVSSLSTPRHALTAVTTGDGKIYAVGGWQYGKEAAELIECYDISKDLWTSGAPMRVPRRLHGVAACKGYIYVFGGAKEGQGFNLIKSCERYDPKSNSWKDIAPLRTAAYVCAVTIGEYIFLFLGS